ncbi:MAG: SGNH/GDSL hydrolase family protein [Acidobacteria bacterium]|nr:SGNH/GDSL hydrolase family protein [Acidobacteriota bacterium]
MLTRRHLLSLLALPAAAQPPALEWHNAQKLRIEGLGFKDRKSPFDRLPLRAEGVVRDAVWNLSRDSSGVVVRFLTNSTTLHARWTLTSKTLASANITATAASGLDLYAKTDAGRWQWLSIGKPTKFPDASDVLFAKLPPATVPGREFMLYLPLRNGVTSLEIGVSPGATVIPGPARPATRKPLAFYGTSITHGISASRPGMTHPAILGRIFDREIINLGFSGNGKMEPEVTRFFAELDPAVFILDCLPNMNDTEVHERTAPCVKTLRAAHPATPILLVEDRNYADNAFNAAHRQRNESNHAALRDEFAKLQADKVPHLYYLKADNLLGSDGEGTIDSSHPTDLGFTRQAAEFERVLRQIPALGTP